MFDFNPSRFEGVMTQATGEFEQEYYKNPPNFQGSLISRGPHSRGAVGHALEGWMPVSGGQANV